MFSCCLSVGSLVLLSTLIHAQGQCQPLVVPVHVAGTYHVATQSWTRGSSASALLGSSVVYDNTCQPHSIWALNPGEVVIDAARLPSPTSPDDFASKPGCSTNYSIDGFDVGYCTGEFSPTIAMEFFDRYVCGTPTSTWGPPKASFTLTGLPGSPAPGIQACWVVTIDLDSPPQTTNLRFTLEADGDGSYGSFDPNPDTFGVAFSMPGSAASGLDGPILAGRSSACDAWSGTIWDPMGAAFQSAGTGMGNAPTMTRQIGSVASCESLPGALGDASLFLELRSASCPPAAGAAFCFGDGSGTACPCGNFGSPGRGCAQWASGQGGWITGFGEPSLAVDNVDVRASGLPGSTSGLLFQGTAQVGSGLGQAFGDGLRCVGGSVMRLGTQIAVGGTMHFPAPGDPALSVRGMIPAGGGTRHYQVWFRASPGFCTLDPFNLTNGLSVSWTP